MNVYQCRINSYSVRQKTVEMQTDVVINFALFKGQIQNFIVWVGRGARGLGKCKEEV